MLSCIFVDILTKEFALCRSLVNLPAEDPHPNSVILVEFLHCQVVEIHLVEASLHMQLKEVLSKMFGEERLVGVRVLSKLDDLYLKA
jgi:hypothetical protein